MYTEKFTVKKLAAEKGFVVEYGEDLPMIYEGIAELFVNTNACHEVRTHAKAHKSFTVELSIKITEVK